MTASRRVGLCSEAAPMIIDDPDDMLDELEDELSEYFQISRDAGPIPTDTCGDLSCRKKLHRFYAALQYAETKLDAASLNIDSYEGLAKRLDVKEGNIKTSHKRLRDDDILVKDEDQPFGHRITDYGLKALLD